MICDLIPLWFIALAAFGAVCLVTLPLYALYVFAVEHFADADEVTHINQKRRLFK